MLGLKRALRIEPDEREPALLLSLYYFLMTAGYVIGIAAIPSLFMARIAGSDDLYPLLMTANAVVTAGLVAMFSRLAKRIPLNALAAGSTLTFAVLFVLLEGLLQLTDWASALMFVLLIAQFNVAAFQYYLIAGTVFNARQSKRILGIAGVGGSVAGILSGLALSPFIRVLSNFGEQSLNGYTSLGTEAVVILMAGLMMLTALVIRLLRPHMVLTSRGDDETDQDTSQPSSTKLLDPYLLTLMALIASYIFVATTVDTQFQAVGIAAFNGDENAFTSFKGVYTAVVGASQMVMRLFVVSPVLVNLGILAGLMTLPTVIISTTASYLFAPGLVTATLMKGGDQTARFTINETSTELTWAPIPPEDRVRVKPFVNGTFIAVVQGVTGVLIFGANRLDVNLSWIVMAVCAVWVPVVIYLQRGYVRKLLDSIQQRQFDFQDLDVDTADSATVHTVDQVLREGTDTERAFMLDVIDSVNVTPWTGALTEAYRKTENTVVRGKIVYLAGHYPDILPDDELMRLMEDADGVRDEAMIAAGERGLTGAIPLLRAQLDAENDVIRAAAARALVTLNREHTQPAQQTLQAMLTDTDTETNICGLDAVNRLEARHAVRIATPDVLLDLLGKSSTVRLRALNTVALTDAPLVTEVIGLLGDSAVEWRARQTLKQFPSVQVRAELLRQYRDTTQPTRTRAGVSRALEDYMDAEVLDAFTETMESNNRTLYAESIDRILTYARAHGLPEAVETDMENEGLRLAGVIYGLRLALHRLDGEDELLMVEMLQLDINELTPKLLKLALMDRPDVDVENVIYRLQQRDPKIIGNVLEILDNVLSGTERAVIVPLFEDSDDAEALAAVGESHFLGLDQSLEGELIFYVNHGDDWQCAVALDYILRHPQLNVHIGAADISHQSRRLLARTGQPSAEEALPSPASQEESQMLSTLEKTVLLKNSTLFENVNARDLYYIAQICEDVTLKAGDVLFEEGEPGDTMYIIARGEVEIYQGEHKIAVSRTGDPIGEIALLDDKPRTASARAVTETDLLAIDSDSFFGTVTAHVNINRAIMRVLAGRMRDLMDG